MANTVAFTTLAIGPESDVGQPTAAAYSAVTAAEWTLISELSSLPDMGDGEREAVTFTSIDKAVVNKLKGTLNYGSGDVVVTRVPGDPGQMAMLAAFSSDKPFMFKLSLPNGTTRLFTANVNSAKQSFGEANDVIKTTYAIDITHAAVEVTPA